MKKTIRVLIVVLPVLIGLGYFLEYDSMFSQNLANKFDATVTITSSPAKVEFKKRILQKFAKEYNISFLKEEFTPRNSLGERQTKNMYLFLHDTDWFEKEFKNINIDNSIQGVNRFEKVNKISLLTQKNINWKPFDKISRNAFVGDYFVKGDLKNFTAFAKAVKKKADINVSEPRKTVIPSDITEREAVLYIIVLLILLLALIFCLLVYNGMLVKEAAISTLLGHSKVRFVIGKFLNLLFVPFLVSFIALNLLLCYLMKPGSFTTYYNAVGDIYKIVIVAMLIMAVIELVLLAVKVNFIKAINALKGYRKNTDKSNMIFKFAAMALTLYLLTASSFSAYTYFSLSPYLKKMDATKNYVNLGCTYSDEYAKNDKKFQKFVTPVFSKLWNELDKKGALFLDAENDKKEGLQAEGADIDDEYLKKQAFYGKYAYINKNMFDYSKILDGNGKLLNIPIVKENEWHILVPDNIKVSSREKKLIEEDHAFLCKGKKGPFKEVYHTIKSNQQLLSFDARKRIEEPKLVNYVLYVVNGRGFSNVYGKKVSSLINGNMHPRVNNADRAYEELKPIIKRTHAEQYVSSLMSVYSEVAEKVDEFKTEAVVNFVGFLLSIIILYTLIRIDLETYFYEQGRRIDVSRLFGHGFWSIHKKKLANSYIVYLLSILPFVVVLMVNTRIPIRGVFIPRDGWDTSKFIIAICIALVGIVCAFVSGVIGLRRGDKDIATRLKEGS